MTETGFRQAVAASLPARLTLPNEIGQALDWLEAEGCVGRYRRTDGRYAALYPIEEAERAGSVVAFHPADPARVRAWMRNDDPVTLERLAIIVRTGGDGSAAALWRDNDGQQRFVHLGSGSGSTVVCTLASDPVDFLRFLAIGYPEPCWAEDWVRTPAASRDGKDPDDAPYLPPERFRHWVESRFGVTVPATASELVPIAATLEDKDSQDPFRHWLAGVQA